MRSSHKTQKGTCFHALLDIIRTKCKMKPMSCLTTFCVKQGMIGWDNVEKKYSDQFIQMLSLHSCPVARPCARTLMWGSGCKIISFQTSGEPPYSRSDRGQPPNHGNASDPPSWPALWSRAQTCEGGETESGSDIIYGFNDILYINVYTPRNAYDKG